MNQPITFLSRFWFPLALIVLLVVSIPGLILFVLNLFGQEAPVNRWLQNTLKLSYHIPIPWWAMLLLLLGVVNVGPVYRMETKPRWDMAAATLAANVRPGDTVFTADPNAPTMLSVLHPKGELPIESTALVTSQLDEALARWRQGSRVWAVNGRSALGQPPDLADFKSRIAALGTPVVEIPQGKEITILMFPAPDQVEAN